MGKKSAQQVATAVSVTPPTKSAKKGNKRDAVGALEKRVSAKKQKLVEQELLKKQNSAAKTKKKQKNTSLEDASESEEEEPVLTAIKLPAVVAKNGSAVVVSKKKDETSEGSDSDSGSDEDDDETEAMVKKLPVAKATNGTAVVSKKNLAKVIPQVNKFPAAVVSKKKDETSDGTESDEEDGDEESAEDSSDDEPSKVQQVKKPAKASMESSGSEEGSFEEESEEEEKPAKTPKKNQSIKASKESSGSEDPSSEEESEEEQPAKTPKNNAKTPATPNVETTGTKTLFAGNLSFSIEKTDVYEEEFFKDVGEIVDVRFASKDGQFKGFGHIEFATEAAAKKALELNGEDLLGRPVKLDLSRERGSYTPHSSKEGNSNQKGGNGQARTLFVRGFDTSAGEDEIRRTLEEHFGSCGEISRMSVPKDYDTGAPKGFAYIDFQNDDSFSKALELNGSELGEYSLVLEEARPRTDNRDGGGSGRGSGGRRGGGRFSGRRGGGRDGGGRFGGRDGGGRFGGGRFGGRDGGGRGGRFGGGGRGRGSGRKTNFDD